MKTSWHAFISGYICCRIYMITIEKRIDFLYLYFFFLYIYLYQFLHHFTDISFWCQNDHTQMYGRKPKWFICRWSWGHWVNDLAEWQSNGLDMIISLIDIDQRQGACLVEGKHLKAFKPFKFHFKRFISWKDWLS